VPASPRLAIPTLWTRRQFPLVLGAGVDSAPSVAALQALVASGDRCGDSCPVPLAPSHGRRGSRQHRLTPTQPKPLHTLRSPGDFR
jgi:hypothetical protein